MTYDNLICVVFRVRGNFTNYFLFYLLYKNYFPANFLGSSWKIDKKPGRKGERTRKRFIDGSWIKDSVIIFIFIFIELK
jgi:hypothetical protein